MTNNTEHTLSDYCGILSLFPKYSDGKEAVSESHFRVHQSQSLPSSSASTPSAPSSGMGTLSVSADKGDIYVGGYGYIGRGMADITLPAGSYTVSIYSPSTGELCWQTNIRIISDKPSIINNNSYCR